VRVHLRVEAEIIERSFAGVEVVVDDREVRSIRPARVEIGVRGPLTDVEAIDPRGVEAFVRLPEDETGTIELPVTGRGMPRTVEIVRVSPAEVRVAL
jgi:hypothetical protein